MSKLRFLKKKNKRRHVEIPTVSLTPLIDTALTLLVIFMITAPIVQNGIKVDLPFGKSKEVGTQQELVITLQNNQKMFFNSYPITKDNLVDTIKKAMGNNEDVPIYVKADKAVAYGEVIEIVDQLKFAGVKFVAMSTRPTT
jgi:biopolymer transport protein ExbD